MPFGIAKEQERFKSQYPTFLKHHDALEATTDKFFAREIKSASKVDRVIFGLGLICGEDFQQAFVLCGNGFGIGALQIVRGMYERQVTAAYLANHPDEIQDFLDYHHVHRRKALTHLREIYESGTLEKIVDSQEQASIETRFQSVKAKFTETICVRCQKTRTMLSWSKHHTGVLAKKGNQMLARGYYAYYYRPTLLSHSTLTSLTSRLFKEEDGSFAFDVDGQRSHITEALINAHGLLLSVLELQNKHFKLGLDEELRERFREFKETWKLDTKENKGDCRISDFQ